jgi:hypothetical protein
VTEKPETTKQIEPTVVEEVASGTAIALNAIPLVGGVLGGIAQAVVARRQSQRLEEFLRELAADLHESEARINREFVKTVDFQNLAEDVISRAADSRQQERLDAMRAVFLNTVLSDRPQYNEAMEIDELVSTWQPRHLVLLKILADPRAADQQLGRVVGNGGGIATSINQILGRLLPEWDDEQIERTWEELRAAGMHNTPGTKTMMTDRGIGQLEGRLTQHGRKVATYIHNPVRR